MQHVDVKVVQGIATIQLDRQEKRNALHPVLIEELLQAFSDVHQERRVRTVVLIGAGTDFCSGLDLGTLGEIVDLPSHEAVGQWFEHWRRLAELLETILRFPKPVIAGVDGGAIGAGLGLAMACDLIVASNSARFSAEAIHRGLVDGTTAALVHFRLGGAQAARLLIAGESLSADELHRIGGCGSPVPSDQIWVAANELGTRCAQGSAEAIQATKRILNEGIGEHLFTQLAAGAAGSATACSTEAAAEGVRAFLEKRHPQWP